MTDCVYESRARLDSLVVLLSLIGFLEQTVVYKSIIQSHFDKINLKFISKGFSKDKICNVFLSPPSPNYVFLYST